MVALNLPLTHRLVPFSPTPVDGYMLVHLITAGGRLLQGMLERCVVGWGGTYAWADTDSQAGLIAVVSRATVAVGADGLIIEVHPCTERALPDDAQSLDFAGFEKVMRALTQPLRQTASVPAAASAVS